MVDDSMEIASEHGHSIFEEDIDIDIDLTTGHFDEDDILDDVDADADFDTNIDDVPAQIETDDLMVDDDRDDASYHMEDADLLEEEADDHNMEQEPVGMPSTVNHPSDNFFHEIHPAEPSIDDVGVSDQYWNDSQVAQPSTGAANAQDAEAIVYGSENIVDNSGISANDLSPQDAQEFAPNLFPHSPTEKDTQPNSPQNPNCDHFNGEHLENSLNEPADDVKAIDPNTHTEDEEHLDLKTTSNESGSNTTINAEDQEQAHPDLNIASDKGGSIDPLNSTFESSKDSDNQNHAREIVVEYNNRNYPLIRKSSADHPNEYFFDDHSVVEKPFNEFCAEIRKVLMEENLPKDDKISLVIEELQLVVEETQLADYPDDLSLGQIIRLYERLVKNDGTGEIPPLHLRLVVQPTGPNRFFALSKGAAEGKGLLHYVTWDADSEDDPTEFGEPNEHHDTESPLDEYIPELKEGERYTGASDVQDENSNTELLTNAHGEQQPHREHIEPATSASAEAPQAEQGESQEEIDDQQSASAEVRQSPGKLQQPEDEDEVDEDGDFIDYDDEEDVEKPSKSVALKSELPETDESRPHNGRSTDSTLPCILPATCLCSSCSDLVLTECRAAEEESRRKSVSLRADNIADDLDGQSGEDTTHASEAAQPNETSQDVESDIDYEENAYDNFNAEKQEHTDENLDSEEGHGTTPNGTENVENVNDLNDTNDEDREYTSYNDNDKVEESGDGEGFDLADQTLQPSHGDYNETEQNGDGEVSDPADSSLEANNVEISFDGDIENGGEDNYGEEEFDLGVGDEEEAEFLQSYQLDHDASFHGSNDFLGMSVGEDATTTDITFNETAAETDSATLSNASITELQEMKPSLAKGQDQEDEIDYDDDDEEDPPSPVIAPQPPTPTLKDSPVSNSGKRLRAETDFEDGDDLVTSEAKRIRS